MYGGWYEVGHVMFTFVVPDCFRKDYHVHAFSQRPRASGAVASSPGGHGVRYQESSSQVRGNTQKEGALAASDRQADTNIPELPQYQIRTVILEGRDVSSDGETLAHEVNDWVAGWFTTWTPMMVKSFSIYRLHGFVVMTALLEHAST